MKIAVLGETLTAVGPRLCIFRRTVTTSPSSTASCVASGTLNSPFRLWLRSVREFLNRCDASAGRNEPPCTAGAAGS